MTTQSEALQERPATKRPAAEPETKRVIREYALNFAEGPQDTEMPVGAHIIKAAPGDGFISVYARVNPDLPSGKRAFLLVYNDEAIPGNDYRYVETVKNEGKDALHLFEKRIT